MNPNLVSGLKCTYYVLAGIAKGLTQFPTLAANKLLTTATGILNWCQTEFKL